MIVTLQVYLYAAFYLVIFALSVWAVVDLVGRPASAFTTAGKRTKSFWALILAVAVAVAFMALPPPIGIGFLSFLALGSAVAAVVYLVDVKPAIGPYSGRRGGRRGRGGRGPSGPSKRGGW